MTPNQKRDVAEAMMGRSKQWKVRLGIAIAIAAIFHTVTGSVFAVCWLLTYAALQAVEWRIQYKGALRRAIGMTGYSWVCLILILVNNTIFGAFGANQMATGTLIGLICGPLLLGGAFLNAVMVSPGSRQVMVAAALPLILYIGLLPVGAHVQGLTTSQTVQITLAALLLPVAGIAAWFRLHNTLHALEAAQGQAEEANRAKSDFLATMSHEIRTPLNGVLGMAQAMAADQLSGRQRERLDVVTQSGQALLTILNDVLDLAKIEARKMELESAVFDLKAVVERSQETFMAIAQSKGLAFETRIAADAVGFYRGDATRLRQILSNLISNAVKFTDEGCVSLNVDRTPDGLVFVVEDTGPGVTADQLPRLFKKFVQADASTTRRYGGTGLGLSICGELAALMGGEIVPERVEPHGLRFTLRLPLEKAEAAAGAVEAVTAAGIVETEARSLRVLAAEDHPVNRQVLTLLLSQAGIIPHIVEDGEQAVQAWREGAVDGPWDLILMDVQMPVMDGPTAARLIREAELAEGRPRVPIVALTANVMTHQVEDYRRCGMDDFVAKPIQVEALLTGIETALARREATVVAIPEAA